MMRLAPGNPAMDISNPHNLNRPAPGQLERPFGIRVTLPPADPVSRLLDPAWRQESWYPTVAERDAALAEMARRHDFNRIGDRPTVVLEAIQR